MSLDTSIPALAHAVKILDRYIYSPSQCCMCLICVTSTNLVHRESRLNAGPLKRPLIDPCAQHSVSTESSKRQHLQLPGTTGTFPTNISGFDMHAPAADITSQIHPDASLLSCQAKSAPTAQSHSKVCTPSFSLNGSDMSSSFSEFAVRQDSAQRTKNDICAPLHNFVSQFNDNTLGNVSFCVAADGFASKTPVNAHVPRPDNLAGLSPAKSTTFLRPVQKVSIYDYNLVLAQHTGLEQQVQVLRDRLRAKTRECEECEQKVSQLAVDLACASPYTLSSWAGVM